MLKTNEYGTSVAFLSEKHGKMYKRYIDASIAGEKVAIGHKLLQRFWLSQNAGRNDS